MLSLFRGRQALTRVVHLGFLLQAMNGVGQSLRTERPNLAALCPSSFDQHFSRQNPETSEWQTLQFVSNKTSLLFIHQPARLRCC